MEEKIKGMEERIGKKIEELKKHKAGVLHQITKWTGELNATNGAIQNCEELLKPEEKKEEKPGEKEGKNGKT